jgi:hypothetical protein
MLMHNPTVGTSAGFIVEPTDALTMDIHIPTEPTEAMEATEAMEVMVDTILTPTGDILLTPMGDIIAHPISGDGVIN